MTILFNHDKACILFCFHHIIGDGASGIQFLSDIISVYNGNAIETQGKKLSNRVAINQIPNVRPPEEITKRNLPKTKILSLYLSESEFGKLVLLSRDHCCTVNAYLIDLFFISSRKVFNKENWSINVSVNLRKNRSLKFTDELMFLSSVVRFRLGGDTEHSNSFTTINKKLWECFFKRQYITNLSQSLDLINERKSDMDYLSQFISNTPTIFFNNAGEVMPNRLPDAYVGAISVNKLHMSVNSQSYMGTSDSFTVNIARVNGAGASIDLNYPSPLVDREKLEQVLLEIKSILG